MREKQKSYEPGIRAGGRTVAAGRRMRTQDMALCGVFTTLMIVGGFLKIPLPLLPANLQFLFTMLAWLFLGGRRGALSIGVYILLGLVGLPVFSEGGGFWYIAKPSFGYLLGFMLAAYVAGGMVERGGRLLTKWVIAINLLGLVIVYGVGMAYYYVICNYVINTPIAFGPLFVSCFVLVAPKDILLCVLTAILTVRVKPVLDRMMGEG